MFPMGAQIEESWKTQDEIDDEFKNIVGHAIRNVKCTLNLAATMAAGATT